MSTEDLMGRLKAFAFILKFGHDLFASENFSEAAGSAVNDSCSILNFKSSALFEKNAGHVQLLSQYGAVIPNPHSHLAVVQKEFLEREKLSDEITFFGPEADLPEEMKHNETVWLVMMLPPPKRIAETASRFIWLLGYEKDCPPFAKNTAKLLSVSISEALYFHRICKNEKWEKVERHARKSWIWLIVGIILTAILIFYKVPESINAEFTLKAEETTAAYAWFDGPISRCLRQNGDWVKKGEVIAEYEKDQLTYRLKMAQSALRESEAELAVEEQNAFSDASKLGQVKLLRARCDSQKIAAEEAKWYLDHAKLRAPAEGILSLTDGHAEMLTGKAVRTGDKLFEIFGGDGITAEIMVNEKDASVLQQKGMRIELYLYNAPEQVLPVDILEISHYPELTDQKIYCYKILVRLKEKKPILRLGMRGVAKIYGSPVRLGYYLFKNAVLYFRGL